MGAWIDWNICQTIVKNVLQVGIKKYCLFHRLTSYFDFYTRVKQHFPLKKTLIISCSHLPTSFERGKPKLQCQPGEPLGFSGILRLNPMQLHFTRSVQLFLEWGRGYLRVVTERTPTKYFNDLSLLECCDRCASDANVRSGDSGRETFTRKGKVWRLIQVALEYEPRRGRVELNVTWETIGKKKPCF